MIKLAILLVPFVAYVYAVPPPDVCVCTFDYTPVCGTDGMTYSNMCTLECEMSKNPDLKQKHDGPCKTKDAGTHKPKGSKIVEGSLEDIIYKLMSLPPCVCAKGKELVCGSDGVTYSNPCRLECEIKKNSKLKKKHDGECTDDSEAHKVTKRSKPSCACPKNRQPVCGSDGETYSNNCLLECAPKTKPGLKKVHDGPCEINETNKS